MEIVDSGMSDSGYVDSNIFVQNQQVPEMPAQGDDLSDAIFESNTKSIPPLDNTTSNEIIMFDEYSMMQ